MSMPQIPEEKFRPDLCEVLIDILKSIAMEENALSHIINTEGEINQAILKKLQSCKDEKSIKELNTSLKQTEKILNTVLMKEWLLLKKIETISDIKELLNMCSEKDKHCDSSDHCYNNQNDDNDNYC